MDLVGFESDDGILVFVVIFYFDFDDILLFDEDGDGDLINDGMKWYFYWVVLILNEVCGLGVLLVKDVLDGVMFKMLVIWLGFLIYIDSLGFMLILVGEEIMVNVSFDDLVVVDNLFYDGVMLVFCVKINIYVFLFCVVDVFDIVFVELSFLGKLVLL